MENALAGPTAVRFYLSVVMSWLAAMSLANRTGVHFRHDVDPFMP
jgi:hypothetical protein